MNSENNSDAAAAIAEGLKAAHSARRRLLLRRGLGAAPAVLTVAAMPVRAGACYSASSFASSNAVATAGTSANARQVATSCAGVNSNYWETDATANAYQNWPVACRSGGGNANFPSCIGATGSTYSNTAGGTASLFDAVSDRRGTTLSNFARFLATAFLNVESGKVPRAMLTNQMMLAMWNNGPTGQYAPLPGQLWGGNEIYQWMISNSILTAATS